MPSVNSEVVSTHFSKRKPKSYLIKGKATGRAEALPVASCNVITCPEGARGRLQSERECSYHRDQTSYWRYQQ